MDDPPQGCGRDGGRSRRDYARGDLLPLSDIQGRVSLLTARLRALRRARTALDLPAAIPPHRAAQKDLERARLVIGKVERHDGVIWCCQAPSSLLRSRELCC